MLRLVAQSCAMVLASLASLAQVNGIYEKIGVGMTMSRNLNDPPMQILISLVFGIAAFLRLTYGCAPSSPICRPASQPLTSILHH